MRVVEIFDSIEGEGLRAGQLATFIRLAGCNLKCSYCDTLYAQSPCQGMEMSYDEICGSIQHGYKNITLTGGEPLIHDDAYILASMLAKQGHEVNIETNGSQNIAPFVKLPNVFVTMDFKCPTSGFQQAMRLHNLEDLTSCDVLKFVVAEEDFETVREIMREFKPRAHVFLSPVFGKVQPSKIVGLLKQLHDDGHKGDIRVQLQLHKIIWDPERRGV